MPAALCYMRAPVFPRACDYRIHLVVRAISLALKLLEFLRCDASVSSTLAPVSIISNIFSFISKKALEMQMEADMLKQLLIRWTHSVDGASLSNCRLEYGNGVFYAETEYDTESKARIFNDLI